MGASGAALPNLNPASQIATFSHGLQACKLRCPIWEEEEWFGAQSRSGAKSESFVRC
jgi:hypothetical protein